MANRVKGRRFGRALGAIPAVVLLFWFTPRGLPQDPNAESPPAEAAPAEQGSNATDAASPGTAPPEDATDPQTGDGDATPESYELLGPPLFPLYDHYLRKRDNTEVLNLLYFYQSTKSQTGDSTLLFPLYYRSKDRAPPDSRLHLFPLLFFHRSSAEASFNVVTPLFFDYRTPENSYRLITPLWFRHQNVKEAATAHHVVFPLSRYRSEGRADAEEGDTEKGKGEVTAFRFGVPKILELFESYDRESDESRMAALSLLNFGDEAKSRIALFHRGAQETASGDIDSRTHFFPLLWAGKSAQRSYFYLFPLFFRSQAGDSDFYLLGPLYGRLKSAESQDTFIPALVSWYGSGANGEVRRNFLWPLYHREYGPGKSNFFSFPLFNYSWTPERRNWRIAQVLYANEYHSASGKTSHSFLWPLGRLDVEPDGVEGHRRFVPLYYDTFDDSRRFRVTPLFLNTQRRSGTEVTSQFWFTLPDYFGWGSPGDYFGFAFPLFWHSRTGKSGWDTFLPVYFSSFRSVSFGIHVFPLISYNSFPSEKLLGLLGPTFVRRTFYDFEGNRDGSSTSVAWPLTAFERRTSGYHYRLLPLFWTSRDGDERDLLLFPFWYRQWGGRDAHDYFFAAYGKYESDRIRREFYGLGSFIHTRERAERNSTFFRDRKDLFWSLLSWQKNDETHESHVHALPLFWRTKSIPQDRTVIAPLVYKHRVEGEERTTHRLDLYGGNVWISKEVEQHRLAPVSPRGREATGGRAAVPTSTVVRSEKGVLWPLYRWGFDREARIESRWLLPFYFDRETELGRTTAYFPFFFHDRIVENYSAKYFRYFFLSDYEHWETGYRLTIGQVIADYFEDRDKGVQRWRFLYPITEYYTSLDGFRYQFTPFMQGSVRDSGGQRQTKHFLFPFYWVGGTEQEQTDGTYKTESDYLYVFPLFGVNRKSLRVQHDILLPFIHTERGIDAFKFQLRPFFFLRNDPEELSVRFWPLHAYEDGAAAGDWWVSKYLYFSKYFHRRDHWSYRLDPYIFRASSSADEVGTGGLFELFAYDRKGSGAWAETSYRALPLLYGFSRQKEATFLSFPLYYEQDFGERTIDYGTLWRFLFLTNHLRGASGDRHTSLLWKLLEYTDNPRRPEFHEFRILHALYQDIGDVSFRQWAMQPFVYYAANEADPTAPEKTVFILPLLGYRYHLVGRASRHYLFWGLPIWW